MNGAAYTLDDEQLTAVIDLHKNTQVVARAGSGKTRVIVAKIAYLVAKCGYDFDEIQVFMFNRTAATEVNERVKAMQIDGVSLVKYAKNHQFSSKNTPQDAPEAAYGYSGNREPYHPSFAKNAPDGLKNTPEDDFTPKIASTFHKFAYDLLKNSGMNFQLIDEENQQRSIKQALDEVLAAKSPHSHLNRERYDDLLKIITSFIVRAGQKYPAGPPADLAYRRKTNTHADSYTSAERLGFLVYRRYLELLKSPLIDFNILMDRGAKMLTKRRNLAVEKLRYLIVDEYQDFSFLFWQLITAIRVRAPAAHLFVVGDDWQMINRFAGSDAAYFMEFNKFFPENQVQLPIATNYRSNIAVVETANRFMLSHYDARALAARPFSRQKGRVKWINYTRTRFNAKDILEDGRADGRFARALAVSTNLAATKVPIEAARLLKTCYKLVKSHSDATIMLLHRHNFTTFLGVSLEAFHLALQEVCVENCIMNQTNFAKQVRTMTMHKSKGLEAEVVLLLEFDRALLLGTHPHAELFPHLGDSREAEKSDQQRLIYVALTRAKDKLYLLSKDKRDLLE